jgi:NAD(P)-dependent dehydrogenase (short-subunit alcohol dehydrogenase family)
VRFANRAFTGLKESPICSGAHLYRKEPLPGSVSGKGSPNGKEGENMEFRGKRVVVIGGSSGIGLAAAKAAAAEGAQVIIASRSEEKLRKAAAEIKGDVECIPANTLEEASLKALFDRAGEFDHLVTPGSEAAWGPFLEMDLGAAKSGFDSKFWGQYQAAKYGAPKIRPGGSITLFSGAYSQRPGRGASLLGAINSAVEGLGRALAVELSPIRVNVVSPGLVDTPIYSGMPEEKRKSMFNAVAGANLVKRIGTPEDIAKTVLYLMGNGYTTGSTLYVEGGILLR